MNPVSAIGIVSDALSFATFSTSLVKGAIQIYDGIQSDQAGSRTRESVIVEMQRFPCSLSPQVTSGPGSIDNGLLLLASQCRELSERLLGLLTKLKPKNPDSKTQTLRAAIRSKLHEGSIKEIEESLDSCRSQLHLELIYNMGRRTQQLLNSLADASSQDAARFVQLQTSLDELCQGVHVVSVHQEAQDSFRQLIGVHEDALSIGARRRILRSLLFQDMRQRYEAVDDPHADTFRWIVEETPSIHGSWLESQPEDLSDDEDIASPEDGYVLSIVRPEDPSEDEDEDVLSRQALAKEKYSRWLRSPDGTLHVSGKLGSGKSTLIEWAGDRTLVSAAFFFWKPGLALQTSISGLTVTARTL